MVDHDMQALLEELETYKTEKESVRAIVGQIGGKKNSQTEKIVNYFFILAIALLFAFDVARHAFHLKVPLPPMFSLEVGVLLVSIKIIWMMHKQAQVEHFQFWILNSIEFRITDVSKRIKSLEQYIQYKN